MDSKTDTPWHNLILETLREERPLHFQVLQYKVLGRSGLQFLTDGYDAGMHILRAEGLITNEGDRRYWDLTEAGLTVPV